MWRQTLAPAGHAHNFDIQYFCAFHEFNVPLPYLGSIIQLLVMGKQRKPKRLSAPEPVASQSVPQEEQQQHHSSKSKKNSSRQVESTTLPLPQDYSY